MKVKFTKPYTTKATPPESFEEGQVVDFAELRGDPVTGEASARHFVNKGVAVEVEERRARAKAAAPAAEKKAEAAEAEPADYDALTVEDLHKLATEREIEGRGGLTTKADLVDALAKSDKAAKRKK